jgi:hypothetical protein
VQEPELFDDQEQEEHARPAGVLKVLSQVPETHAAQGSEVNRVILRSGHRVIFTLSEAKGLTFEAEG